MDTNSFTIQCNWYYEDETQQTNVSNSAKEFTFQSQVRKQDTVFILLLSRPD